MPAPSGRNGSGSSGKNGGGYYYVQLYMHEQIQTLVKPAKANGKAATKKKVVKTSSSKRKAVKKVAKKTRK